MRIDLFDKIKKNELPMELVVSTKEIAISIPESEGRPEGAAAFSLTLMQPQNDRVSVAVCGQATFKVPCARCLDDVRLVVDLQTEVSFTVTKSQVTDDPDDPVGVIHEGILDVDSWLSEELLVRLPSKVLCEEDCKGLCPVCGQNLNQSECGCDRFVMDPRMQKFLDVFSEAKEV